jgi:acyl-CoA dehydrogenase
MLSFIVSVVVLLAVVMGLAYVRAQGVVWAVALGLALLLLNAVGLLGPVATVLLGTLLALAIVLLGARSLRLAYVIRPLFDLYKKVLPQVSQTEQEALDAGTVWWDGDLFSGNPDWNKLLSFPAPRLSAEEQAFIDGPVEEACAMLDDWKISHELYDLPPEAWRYLKDKGFLGMIIPKQYGGLGFSAFAHSEVVMKLSTRCNAAAVSVMVPNSLGPAELLLHYGTDEQKNYYLPRLAKGQEIPCFALTGPEAGSDAASIPDYGIVCRGEWQGKRDVLGLRLTWEKRYITLGPVATLLGLAFKLFDPDKLLGDRSDLGITLALIPTNLPGVNIGRRHLPLNGVFQNGPNSGKDVFIPLEQIIGGVNYVGQGWKMLMNCLAAGRSISLPSQSVAAAKLAARTTGAYARVRTQFNMPIGRFEGVEEALARIGGNAYMMDAARTMTAGAVDLGEKPAVLSAIVKYHLTERMRTVINEAMDVHGGKGICLGPSNYLGRAYQLLPVAITVEGANILTRSMIIFGQGAIRSHPFVLKEIAAAQETQPQKALELFDDALRGHVRFAIANAARAFVLGLSGGRGVQVPGGPETKRYYQMLTRFAAGFGLLADVSMLVLGGALKRREKISARLGDVLSYLYLCSAALKKYEDQGREKAELPLLQWPVHDAFFRMQVAFDGVLSNFPNRVVAWVLRRLIFPKGLTLFAPSDQLGHQVADLLLNPSAARDRLTAGMYLPKADGEILAQMELALTSAINCEPIYAKLRRAQKEHGLSAKTFEEMVAKATEASVVTAQEADQLRRARAHTRVVIMVDDFPQDFGRAALEKPALKSVAAA